MPYRMRRQDGVYRLFLNNGTPYFRKADFSGFFGTCINITDEKEMEAHQKVLLGELNHRVKNNLQLIISFMQISLLKAEGEEAPSSTFTTAAETHAYIRQESGFTISHMIAECQIFYKVRFREYQFRR
ncbi:histidine kinase dimerization/phosphoacceptor domain -containing protein [Pseudomonas yamanorum]|uniref:histidine kinase dimerization/phosphoacceptor domain -containing protein n=1 Tax=Pseudomonas yamanorum TaxID=515393 RepID=UPI003D36A063